jgi:hypothetical protein
MNQKKKKSDAPLRGPNSQNTMRWTAGWPNDAYNNVDSELILLNLSWTFTPLVCQIKAWLHV